MGLSPRERIHREALKRGCHSAKKKVVIGDGAEWIWTLVAEHFPEAIQIVDLYHARQHLWEVARQLYPHEESKQKAWMKAHQKRLLDKGKIEKLVSALRSINTPNTQIAEKIRTEAEYFETNAERMRYPKFHRQHLFIGSGVIEAWRCAAPISMAASRIIGRAVARLRQRDYHSYVAHPAPAVGKTAVLQRSGQRLSRRFEHSGSDGRLFYAVGYK